jgi:hypothetical protein
MLTLASECTSEEKTQLREKSLLPAKNWEMDRCGLMLLARYSFHWEFAWEL